MEEAERARWIAKLAADAADLLATMRAERNRRQAAGDDVAWLDRVLPELERLATMTHDTEVAAAIFATVARHGSGPYPPDEMAILAGISPDDALRVSEQMVAEGFAIPTDDRPPDV